MTNNQDWPYGQALQKQWDEESRRSKLLGYLWGVIIVTGLLTLMLVCQQAHAGETAETQIIAEVVAAEAAGEGTRGMQGIANVIANRARQGKKTPYQIVTAKNQFYGYTARNRSKLYLQVKKTADDLAQQIMALPDITGGALFFRRSTEPRFAWCKIKTVEIKNHIFYK